MKPPNSRERQVMQHLRGAGWVNALGLPDSPKIIANLITKGWVECQRTESGRRIALQSWDFRPRKRRFSYGPSQDRDRKPIPPPGQRRNETGRPPAKDHLRRDARARRSWRPDLLPRPGKCHLPGDANLALTCINFRLTPAGAQSRQ
jgi:hypothetical protein